RAGCRRCSGRRAVASTCRTCRPRRSSPPRTAVAQRARSPRACRCRSRATSWRGSASGSSRGRSWTCKRTTARSSFGANWTATTKSREDRYAELAVRVGANVQPGQLVDVVAQVEHAAVARAVAREVYEAGAAYVDVYYSDQHIRRALIEFAADDLLSWTPPW